MGNVIDDLTNCPAEEQGKYAEEFCEGNEDLKKLLLKMWKAGIQTYACCAGHDYAEGVLKNGAILDTNPYIYFDVKSLDEKQQKKLYKNLMMISKNLGLVEQFDLKLDNNMDFVKHGLKINLKNDTTSYKVLNDLFDSVLQKEGLIEKAKKFLIKRDENDGLTQEELDFVNSMVELNGFKFEEYINNSTKTSPDEKIADIRLVYERGRRMKVEINDAVKEKIYYEGDDKIVFYCPVAEGMFTKDPHIPDLYYTIKDGKVVELNGLALGGLKEYKSEREWKKTEQYKAERFDDIKSEIEKVVFNENLKDV